MKTDFRRQYPTSTGPARRFSTIRYTGSNRRSTTSRTVSWTQRDRRAPRVYEGTAGSWVLRIDLALSAKRWTTGPDDIFFPFNTEISRDYATVRFKSWNPNDYCVTLGRLDHYKRPPSRDSSVDRYARVHSRLTGSRQPSVDKTISNPAADMLDRWARFALRFRDDSKIESSLLLTWILTRIAFLLSNIPIPIYRVMKN